MIETERLLLRPHKASDFDDYRAMSQDPEVMRYIGRQPSTDDEAWLRFLAHAGRWEICGYGLFAIIDKETDRYLGDAGFGDFRRDLGAKFDPYHEAAWMLSSAAQGKGYAFEAMSAAQLWLDDKYSPAKTVCIISPDNPASIKLAGRLGYQETGLVQYRDSDVMAFERNRN